MAKKRKQQTEEQLDLIDVRPENAKKILPAARAYKKVQSVRLSALAEEKQLKQKVIRLTKEAGLVPLPDGTIKFTLDGVIISIKPRDELLTVKELEEQE